MKSLRVCFVGYGSIAKRHIKNLYMLCKSKNISLEIDVLRHNEFRNCKYIEYPNVDNVKYKKLKVEDKYDILFITNPTSEHYKTLNKYKNNAKMFFVEKPLVNYSDLSRIKKISIKNDKVYVACPLRYKKVIQFIKNNINKNDVICTRVICSSYLPNWRPNTDYKKTYSAIKKLGGGVRLDLIHEWDYIKYLFGKPNNIIYKYGKCSNLKIDTEDYASYIAEYKNKFIELHIDYFGKSYQRKIELYLNDDVLVIDLYKNTIKSLINGSIVNYNESRDEIQINELSHFLDIFYKNIRNDSNLNSAINTIELTRGKVK